MKITNQRLQQLIRESILDWGKILFSPDRTDGVSTEEPNTKTEEDLFYGILNWQRNQSDMSEKTILDLRYALSNNEFNDILSPPASETLYRGITMVKKENLARLLGIPADDLQDSGTKEISLNDPINNPGMLSKTRGYDSWTEEFEVSQWFSRRNYAGSFPTKEDIAQARKNVMSRPDIIAKQEEIRRLYNYFETEESRSNIDALWEKVFGFEDELEEVIKQEVSREYWQIANSRSLNRFNIILEAKLSDNNNVFLSLSNVLSKINAKKYYMSDYQSFKETISLFPVKINKIHWTHSYDEEVEWGFGTANYLDYD
jgi:hypothetical protein